MQINKEFLKSLSPCKDRWKNYLKYYDNFSGSLSEFMELDKISVDDKFWLFTKEINELKDAQREFAFICADRVVSEANIKELTEFHELNIHIYESGNLELLNSDEYYAADSAANRAAYNKEREIQLDIIKNLLPE